MIDKLGESLLPNVPDSTFGTKSKSFPIYRQPNLLIIDNTTRLTYISNFHVIAYQKYKECVFSISHIMSDSAEIITIITEKLFNQLSNS